MTSHLFRPQQCEGVEAKLITYALYAHESQPVSHASVNYYQPSSRAKLCFMRRFFSCGTLFRAEPFFVQSLIARKGYTVQRVSRVRHI